jgi:hypothetical protein
MKPLTSRLTSILGTYYLANEPERSAGRMWYSEAHLKALYLSWPFSCGIITSAGVIAALSPHTKWEQNLRDAQTLFDRFKVLGADAASQVKVSTYGANKAKALTILKLQSPTVDDVAAVLNGLKSIAFYRCILGDSQAVCVDGHAYSIWAGEHITTPKTPKISPRLYNQIANDYRTAALIISTTSQPIEPSELQAITWLTHKRLFGR